MPVFRIPGPEQKPHECGKRESIPDRVGAEHLGNFVRREPGYLGDFIRVAYFTAPGKAAGDVNVARPIFLRRSSFIIHRSSFD